MWRNMIPPRGILLGTKYFSKILRKQLTKSDFSCILYLFVSDD